VAEAILVRPVEGTVIAVEVEDDLVVGMRLDLGVLFHQEGLQGIRVLSILW
jgi:hypothetical protein